MSRPNALIKLLSDLKAESCHTTVVTIGKSSATICLEDDAQELVLTPEECELLLDSTDTVQQLFEALGTPSWASLELDNVSVDDEVMDALTETFSSVDSS